MKREQTKQHSQVIYLCVSLWSPSLCLKVRSKMSNFFDDHFFPYQKITSPRVVPTIFLLAGRCWGHWCLASSGFGMILEVSHGTCCRIFGQLVYVFTNATTCCGLSSTYLYINIFVLYLDIYLYIYIFFISMFIYIFFISMYIYIYIYWFVHLCLNAIYLYLIICLQFI